MLFHKYHVVDAAYGVSVVVDGPDRKPFRIRLSL